MGANLGGVDDIASCFELNVQEMVSLILGLFFWIIKILLVTFMTVDRFHLHSFHLGGV